MRRFLSKSHKQAAPPYQTGDDGISNPNMLGNPVPSMANLRLNNIPRSGTSPPPSIYEGYVSNPRQASGFFGNGELPPPPHQPPQALYSIPDAFYNGVNGANTGSGRGQANNRNSMGGGARYPNNVGYMAPTGAGGIRGGSVNNGSSHRYSYSDNSFLNSIPTSPSNASRLTSPPSSVGSQINESSANVNNITPPPQSGGTGSAASRGSGAYAPPHVALAPSPQNGRLNTQHRVPHHVPSYMSLHQVHQQQQQQQYLANAFAADHSRQQRPIAAAPTVAQPVAQPSAKPHRNFFGKKSKSVAALAALVKPLTAAAPVAAAPANPQRQRQPPPPPPPTSQPMTTQQHALTHVAVTAADIRDTTYMLRQLYKMELSIHGQRYAIHEEDLKARRETRRKADMLREEIENNVNTWSTTMGAKWTLEEEEHVAYSGILIGRLQTLAQDEEN